LGRTTSASVVDQDVQFPGLVEQTSHCGHVFEVGRHEASTASLRLDFLDYLASSFGVAAVNDDLPSVACES